jgi:hypothetical protein
MSKLRAQITTWYQEAHPGSGRWGFATTPTGKIFFVHTFAFRDHRQVARVGSVIEFDEQTAKQSFIDKLNSGKYRDDTSLSRRHRNPRRGVTGKIKPRATNVVVIEGETNGKV